MLYTYSCAAQEVQVCVSYGGPELGELFINVNWNVSCMLHTLLKT